MSKSQVEHDIQRLLNNEVDDAQRAIRNGDLAKAKRELDDVEDKLKHILRDVAQIQER